MLRVLLHVAGQLHLLCRLACLAMAPLTRPPVLHGPGPGACTVTLFTADDPDSHQTMAGQQQPKSSGCWRIVQAKQEWYHVDIARAWQAATQADSERWDAAATWVSRNCLGRTSRCC